ncbi:MAG: MBL fold metallo-hydrolase [Anaerolineae bacterium]|nr:MBL fold metallo-hydrolase [Anaerolineae bacterium]MDW8099477.1 MBL fold metallo-hydrolase [Anaerolineae bacterium]
MDLIRLAESVYQLQGGTNVGLIVDGSRALAVDAGLDRDAGRRVVRAAEELGIRITAVAITHAHADHFGGAAEIKRRTGAMVYAPAFEAAIVENPELEAYYLFSGAQPPAELRHKFILAPSCPVDGRIEPGPQILAGFAIEAIPMPGHAQNQMMIAHNDVCFAGDAFFQPAVLEKYGIPFYVDITRAQESLERLAALNGCFTWFVPGHGSAITDITSVAELNLQRIQAIREHVRAALREPIAAEGVLATVTETMGISISTLAVYYLTFTTIHACLSALQAAGEVTVEVRDNRALWHLIR